MINIIKGNIYLYKIKCYKCDCIFEFQDEDIKQDFFSKYGYVNTIKCPVCGQKISSYYKSDWLKKEWDK